MRFHFRPGRRASARLFAVPHASHAFPAHGPSPSAANAYRASRAAWMPWSPLIGLTLAGSPIAALADVSVIQPPTVVAAKTPLTVTLLYAEDANARGTKDYAVPETLPVSLASGDLTPQTLMLHRQPGAPSSLHLRAGTFRRIAYTAPWPDTVRGTIRIQVADFNAAPALVTLDRGARQAETIASNRAIQSQSPAPAVTPETAAGDKTAAATPNTVAPAATAAIPASGASIGTVQAATAAVAPESRLSFYEPMYIGVGKNGHTTSRFQLSFKYRVIMPDDPRSKSLLNNLYFGYTQTSLWDLTANSAPFRDTSYKPSLFYYLPDVGLRSPWFDSLGVQAGLEHESNGKAGDTSRSINIVYAEPIIHFHTPASTELTISPKMYYYLQKDENSDIAAYRGYADLQIRFGRPDGLELFTILRKGTHALNGSVDAQLTYPVQKLFGGALGGYVWLGYFNGYGETLLDYNDRQHWIVRLGYSIYR